MEAKYLNSLQGKAVKGPLLLTPKVFLDERGFFLESWNKIAFKELLTNHGQDQANFVQDNHSRSEIGVLRGLHYQLPPYSQGKLVRCVAGEIYDVAVDLRRSSPTYSYWVGVNLSAENRKQMWIPKGFAHGFLALSDQADVVYKTNNFWKKDYERAIRWNDSKLAINWNKFGILPKLSNRDENAPYLNDLDARDLFE